MKNFGISQERVDKQFALGKEFYELPLEEKLKYVPEGLGKYNLTYVSRDRCLSTNTQSRDSLTAMFQQVDECTVTYLRDCFAMTDLHAASIKKRD